MKNISNIILLFLFICLSSDKANALSGNELLQDCRSDSYTCQVKIISFFSGFSVGSINGYFYAKKKYGIVSSSDYTDIVGFCAEGLDLYDSQIKDIVVSYLENNPNIRHKNASTLMVSALREAIPCN